MKIGTELFCQSIKESVAYGDRYKAIKVLPDNGLDEAIKALKLVGKLSNLTINQKSLLSALNLEHKNRMPCGNCHEEQCKHCS